MAEAAGFVVGAIGLVTLFDTCMNLFERFESAKNHGKEYEAVALRISMLQLRLSRWGQSIKFEEQILGQNIAFTVATEDEVQHVHRLLDDIRDDLETAERISHRYKPPELVKPSTKDAREIGVINTISNSMRTLSMQRQKSSTTKQKARWALYDQRKLRNLVGDLDHSISALVDLFPTVKQAQLRLAVSDVHHVVRSEGDLAKDDLTLRIRLLHEASLEVDKLFNIALGRAIPQGVRHIYNQTLVEDNARATYGDFSVSGKSISGPGHMYHNVVARGNSFAHYGDIVGAHPFYNGMHEIRRESPEASQRGAVRASGGC